MEIHLDARPHRGNHFTRNGRELVSQAIIQLKTSLQDSDAIPTPHRQLLIDRLNYLAAFGASEIIKLYKRPYRSGRRDRKHQKYIRGQDNHEGEGWNDYLAHEH